ncbi:MAG: hypothetical protein SPL13_06605 [Clostridia bacterium]|nr:hypothetical protein [Clostridia bacterium]
MNRIKKIAIISLALISVCCLALFAACGTEDASKTAGLMLVGEKRTEYLVGDSIAEYSLRYYADVENTDAYENVLSTSSSVTVNGFSTESAGTDKTVTFSYKGKSVSLKYNVYEVPTSINIEDGEYFLTKNKILTFNSATKTVSVSEYDGYKAYQSNTPKSTESSAYTLTVSEGITYAMITDKTKIGFDALYYSDTYSKVMKVSGSSESTVSKFNAAAIKTVASGMYGAINDGTDRDLSRYKLDAQGNRVSNGEGGYVRIYFNVYIEVNDTTLSLYYRDIGDTNKVYLLTNAQYDYDIMGSNAVIRLSDGETNYSISAKSETQISFVRYEESDAKFGFSGSAGILQ